MNVQSMHVFSEMASLQLSICSQTSIGYADSIALGLVRHQSMNSLIVVIGLKGHGRYAKGPACAARLGCAGPTLAQAGVLDDRDGRC